MRNRLRCVFILAAALAFVVSATPSPAQTWPQRPVKFLVTARARQRRRYRNPAARRPPEQALGPARGGREPPRRRWARRDQRDDRRPRRSRAAGLADVLVHRASPIARVSNTIIVMAVPADPPGP